MGLFKIIGNLFNKEDKKEVEMQKSEGFDVVLKDYSSKSNEDKCVLAPLTLENLEKAKKRVIAIDFETTGLSYTDDRIIEIGAVIFQNGKVVDRYSTLVNPLIHIPETASKVNHITDTMVRNAPSEESAIKKLVSFVGNAINGETLLCAHNANFDSKFLVSSLDRYNIKSRFMFIDTVQMAKKCINDINNYKLETLSDYFCVTNKSAHRAVEDAETCGLILLKLCNILTEKFLIEKDEKAKEIEAHALTDIQKEWCAVMQNKLIEHGLKVDRLSFERKSGNTVYCNYVYNFLRIKFGKRVYVLTKKSSINKSDFVTEECNANEDSEQYIRVLFESPFELEAFMPYIISEFLTMYNKVQQYIREERFDEKTLNDWSEYQTTISSEEIPVLIESAKRRIEDERVKAEELNRVNEEKALARITKQKEKEQKAAKKQENAGDSKIRKRAIYRLDDNGTILEEYPSIAEAISKTGINSKSIRDAANGVQKHAGGFCWRYKDEE